MKTRQLILKTLGYRILSAALVLLVTGSVGLAIGVELLKVPVYFVYETFWQRS